MLRIGKEITSQDIFAISAAICLLFAPFIEVKNASETAAVFVAKMPVGNSTVAINSLTTTKTVFVTVYMIHKWSWYIFIQVIGTGEFVLLYLKIRSIRPECSWCYSSVLDHGGACIANTEFWVFIFLHHILVCFFVLNTASLYGVISLILPYVLSLALLCEPNDDCGRQHSQTELYTNRLLMIAAAIFLTLYVFFRDEQFHSSNLYTEDNTWTVLTVQILLDAALLFAHCTINAQLLIAYMARLLYVAACNVVMVIWFVV